MEIKELFKEILIDYNNMILYHPSDALNVIKKCKDLNKKIFGIDAFQLCDDKIQPFMEYSIDYSVNDTDNGYWDESMEFIKKYLDKDLVFEIIYEGY